LELVAAALEEVAGLGAGGAAGFVHEFDAARVGSGGAFALCRFSLGHEFAILDHRR
jgi:hypothetical protein